MWVRAKVRKVEAQGVSQLVVESLPPHGVEVCDCSVASLVDILKRRTIVSLEFEGSDESVRSTALEAIARAWPNGIDLSKILAHPETMREQVERIQSHSRRERDRLATLFLLRRSGVLQTGAPEDELLRSFFEHEFRLERTTEIENCLVAGKHDEAKRDLQSLVEDSGTWASWMLEAHSDLLRRQGA